MNVLIAASMMRGKKKAELSAKVVDRGVKVGRFLSRQLLIAVE